VEKGFNRPLLLEVGMMMTTAKRLHVYGTLGGMWPHGCGALLGMGHIREEERDVEGSVMGMVGFVIAVRTGTMKHLAGRTCYAARTRLGVWHTGARGK
jgi:hypothetical protein